MSHIRHAIRCFPLWFLACFLIVPAFAEDWPTYMHDYARGGVTAETVAPPFNEIWAYHAPAAPKPAWPEPQAGYNELPKVIFDDALYTVAAGDSVYFGSSVDHKVYALDAATGKVRWAFFTDGPVRLAPTVYKGRVYVGSDDGFAYCLDAADGRLIWKARGGPDGRRVLGNGRLISLWPVRTSVIVDGDIAYFGAGVFPHHGVFAVAVNAADGTPVWRVPGFQGDRKKGGPWFTPQGYWLASDQYLFAPSARSVAACFNRADGANVYLLGNLNLPQAAIGLPKGVAGGAYGLLAEGLFYSGTQGALYGFTQDSGKQAVTWPGALRLLATSMDYFVMTGPSLVTKVSTAPGITAYNRTALQQAGKRDEETLKACTRWRYDRKNLTSMICAGTVLFAGGHNEVIALDAATGRVLWKAPVDGKAAGLMAAAGRLFVCTDRGTIHCFAPGAAVAPANTPGETLPADPVITSAAQAVLADAKVTKGCCLVMGSDSSRLALEIAKQTEMQVFAFEPDAAKAQRARQLVDAAGLYGTRVVVDSGAPESLPYPNYFANLVVTDPGLPVPAAELQRVLRPYGGKLLTGAANVPGNAWTKLVRGPLEGAGSWTHQYANPGNTTSSEDQRVKGQLDVLWFGEPGPAEMPDRHLRNVAPLTVNGRVFYQGFRNTDKRNYVACFDAYNGTKYWERDLPGAYRVGITDETSNMACSEESLFVVVDSSCHRLNQETGEIVATYQAPLDAGNKARPWSYIATIGDLLFGSISLEERFSHVLFAIDLKTGERRWVYRDGGQIRNNTIAVCDGRLLFAEMRNDAREVDNEDATRNSRLGLDPEESPKNAYPRTVVALDVETGKPAWTKIVDLTDCGPWASQLFGMAKDGAYVLCGGYSRYGGLKGGEEKRRVLVLSVKDGSLLWNNAVGNLSRPLIVGDQLICDPHAFALQTGAQKVITNAKTGKTTPWKMSFVGAGCGPMTASAGMLFFRYGFAAWYDIATMRGATFHGPRPGCWMNIIPANGVVVQTEASSGCTCYHSLQCTLVYQPRAAK